MFEKDPRLFDPEYKKLPPEQKAMVKLEITLTSFFRDFNASIARWERIVYPVVAVLTVLVLSGFYLIYSLTQDMHEMVNRVDPRMEQHLEEMSKNIAALSKNISAVTSNMTLIADKMDTMDNSMANINANISTLSNSVAEMNTNVHEMNYTVADMNKVIKVMSVNTGLISRDIHKIQKPMQFFP